MRLLRGIAREAQTTSRLAVLAVLVLGACADDIDPPWQLDHDRIIAVRSSPPRIPAGARAEIDAFLGRKGTEPTTEVPPIARVVSPESLASALVNDAGRWVVTAPDDSRLAVARTELGLMPGAPVPLTIGVAFAATSWPSGGIAEGLGATKIVWLGATGDNPVLDSAQVDGVAPAMAAPIVIAKDAETRLAIAFDDRDDINWMTSCGTMHDFDLPEAYLTVEPEDPVEGHLAVVVRTDNGGVSWRIWPMRAE